MKLDAIIGPLSESKKQTSLLGKSTPTIAEYQRNGLHTYEKPSYWEDLEKESPVGRYKPWSRKKLKQFELSNGFELEEFDSSEIFGFSGKPRGPQVDAKLPKGVEQGLIKFSDGTTYFADFTYANSYIRLWALVKD